MGRIIVNRKKAEFATDFEGNSSDWSETKGEFKRNHAANEALFQIKGKVSQIKSFYYLKKKRLTPGLSVICSQKGQSYVMGLLRILKNTTHTGRALAIYQKVQWISTSERKSNWLNLLKAKKAFRI